MTREKLRQTATALIFATLLALSVAPPVAAGGNAVEAVSTTSGSFMERICRALWEVMEALGLRFQERGSGDSAIEPSPGLAAKYGTSYDPFG